MFNRRVVIKINNEDVISDMVLYIVVSLSSFFTYLYYFADFILPTVFFVNTKSITRAIQKKIKTDLKLLSGAKEIDK